jgi:large subunit ribosomal protein L24
MVSGGYDIPADQADIRASVASTVVGAASSRPEIQLFAAGSPDTLNRTVDVAALSSWLAVRAIDRETRRLDSIERGEPPPSATPASIPPPVPAPPLAPELVAPPPDQPSAVQAPGRDPRPIQPPKARVSAPRPPAAPPAPGAPVVSQQVTPLPPPIEVRPAPGSVKLPPKPKPPLVLTPQVANPPRSSF